MRAIAWALAVAAAAPSTAYAEDEVETREGRQRELGLGSRLEVAPGGLRWGAFAQLAGEAAADVATGARDLEGAAAVGAELRVASARCDLVRIGGQARLAWSGAARPSAEQWASGCLDHGFFMAELGHHLEWDVRPSLLAPIQLRAGLNRRETVRMQLEMFRMPLTDTDPMALRAQEPPAYLVLFQVDVDMAFLWSEDAPLTARQRPQTTGIRYERAQLAPWGERRDFAVNAFAGGGEFTDAGSSVYAWVVRLDNLALGPLYASGGIGVSSAGVGPFVDELTHEIELTTPLAMASLETGGDLVHGHLRAQHDVALTPDGLAVIDSRLTSGLRLDAEGTRVGLDGFLALTELHAPGREPLRGVTGGAALALARGLGAHLEATVQLEAARSFYAAAPDEMAGPYGPPRWGVNAMAALQATAGRRGAPR